MKSKKFLKLIIFFLSVFCWENASASMTEKDVRAWAQDKGERLLNTFNMKNAEEKYAALDELFLNHVDLDYVGKFVVGKYWKEMSPEQQQQYLPLFKRYALGLYKTFPLDFDVSKIIYEITRVEIRGNEAEVSAVVDVGKIMGGQQSSVIPFSLRIRDNGGQLQIIDIKLAESSLILSYRGKFYGMIAANDEDISWFLEDLEDLAVSAEKNNQLNLQNNY